MRGKKWIVLLASLAVVLLASSTGLTGSSFVDLESSGGNSFQAWASNLWRQTTQEEFNAGVLNNVDTAASPGDVKSTLSAGGGKATNSPSSSTGGWTNPTNAYADGTNYASATSTGTPSETYGNYDFNLAGYTISQVRVSYDAWSAGVSSPTKYEYYETGDDDNSGGAWASYKLCQTFTPSTSFTMTSVKLLLYKTQATTGPGIVTCGIYATTGSPAYPMGSALTSGTTNGNTLPTGSPYEWRQIDFSSGYSLNANTTYAIVIQASGGNSGNAVWWRCDASSPTYSNGMYGRSASSGAWGTSYMDNTKDDLFQTYGNGTEYNDQIRVDVSWDVGNTWSNKQVTSLTSSETTYWYDVTSATSWDATKLNNTNFKVRVDAYTQGIAEEVRLDWLPVEVTYTGGGYASLGTIASQVLDTGVAGARWDALFWDETLQSGTDLTFEVRASDTPFVADTPPATLPWTSVVGTSPVTSGLPSGRYMQWRATLTTSDTSKTPTLHDVRVYHY
jgi:hypothetical protein